MRNFTSLFIRGITCNFLFCVCSVFGMCVTNHGLLTVNLRTFSSLQFFFSFLVLTLLYMFCRMPLWNYLILNFVGSILITNLISILVIFLLRLYISSWFSLKRLYAFRNQSVSSRFSNLLTYNWSEYSDNFLYFCGIDNMSSFMFRLLGSSFPTLYFKIYFYFLPVVGVCCCTSVFSSCCEQGLLSVMVGRLLIAITFLVECRL